MTSTRASAHGRAAAPEVAGDPPLQRGSHAGAYRVSPMALEDRVVRRHRHRRARARPRAPRRSARTCPRCRPNSRSTTRSQTERSGPARRVAASANALGIGRRVALCVVDPVDELRGVAGREHHLREPGRVVEEAARGRAELVGAVHHDVATLGFGRDRPADVAALGAVLAHVAEASASPERHDQDHHERLHRDVADAADAVRQDEHEQRVPDRRVARLEGGVGEERRHRADEDGGDEHAREQPDAGAGAQVELVAPLRRPTRRTPRRGTGGWTART